MFLIIDNYDSFAHNLARYFRQLKVQTQVVRNDEITADEALALNPTGIVLSPGPCTPLEAGICLDLVKRAGADTALLGICLGHQAIAQAHGGLVKRVPPVHGKASAIHHDGRGIFQDVPSPFTAGRYHSLAVDLKPGGALVATAHALDGIGEQTVMALAHRSLPQVGLQFHPESVLTEHGYRLLQNFVDFATGWQIARRVHQEAAQ